MGFVKILKAWLESLKGIVPLETEAMPLIFEPKPEEKLEYQYELVFRIRKKEEDNRLKKIKEELSLLGGSIELVETEKEAKVHIHTNFPEKIKEKVKDFEILEWRFEDLLSQVRKISQKNLWAY